MAPGCKDEETFVPSFQPSPTFVAMIITVIIIIEMVMMLSKTLHQRPFSNTSSDSQGWNSPSVKVSKPQIRLGRRSIIKPCLNQVYY